MTTQQPRVLPANAGAGNPPQSSGQPLLEVTDLSVTFQSEAGPVTAVRNLSYEVRPGEVLGIVGESGSGKSVSSLAIMGLLPDSAKVTGSVAFQGQE
ncbi:MAG TPA: ATP-binding cassette domain-containing protein, partial [Micromonospora sp.]|nr:ATP-binding cassette domain-containing protein [Micromonospora sp.]